MQGALGRQELADSKANQPAQGAQPRPWAKLNPLSGVPLRALPSSPLVQLIDEELVWIMLNRLGIKPALTISFHPEAAGIRKSRVAPT